MKCSLITETIDGRTFIGGYYSDKNGLELPDKIVNVEWRDKYGNYNWELLSDGTVAAANLTTTTQQQTDEADRAFAVKASPIFFKLLKKAIQTTATPGESWKALDAAIRSLLN